MEKTVEVEVKTTNTVHKFYCDKCNKEIGVTTELPDGYYQKRGVFEEKMFLPGFRWISLQGNLCDECAKHARERIAEQLKGVSDEFNLKCGNWYMQKVDDPFDDC